MYEFEQIVKVAYWVLFGVLAIILLSRFIYFRKTKEKRIPVNQEQLLYQVMRYVTIMAIPVFIYGIITFVFVLQRANLFALEWMKLTFAILLIFIMLTEMGYNTFVIPSKISRVLNITFCLFFVITGYYFLNLYSFANEYPPVSESVMLELPFEGTWKTTGAGGSSLTNHHNRIPSQVFAIDIAKLGDDGRLFSGQGVELEENHTFGADIFAPVNGQVVHLVDSLPDIPTRERENLTGNHVIIQFQDTLFVALAHLMENSITVQIGDHVSVGDYLGQVGLSGNTDFSHLHIHVQDGPIYDLEDSRTYPIRFRDFHKKRFLRWGHFEKGFLLGNDEVRK